MAEVVRLPKYGLFRKNDADRRQIKEMKSRGYKIYEETWSERIWMKVVK